MPAFIRLPRRARAVAFIVVFGLAAVGGWATQRAVHASTPPPAPIAIVCPLATANPPIVTVTITIPRCPPPCPLRTTTTSTTTIDGPSTAEIAGRCCPPVDVAPATPDAGLIVCPPPTLPSTTVPPTIPIDGWAIAGVTENQLCAGPSRPEGCAAPFTPASDQVVITQAGVPVASVTSDSQGRFRVPVGPGTYTAQAAVKVPGANVTCPSQTVRVAGPPVPTVITLRCTIQLP